MNAQGTFAFGNGRYDYARNEGERAVEIPIARLFYERHGRDPLFVEVGAVTPYWWSYATHAILDDWTTAPVGEVPHRVVDPHDDYPLAERVDVLDLDLAGRIVLSISTIEHVGMGDYGDRPIQPHMAAVALRRLVEGSAIYLVTWPTGHNRALDEAAAGFVEWGLARGFQYEQHEPHEYRIRDGWDWNLPYGAPSSMLPYGRGVVFLTNDPELLAAAEKTPR